MGKTMTGQGSINQSVMQNELQHSVMQKELQHNPHYYWWLCTCHSHMVRLAPCVHNTCALTCAGHATQACMTLRQIHAE